MAETKFLGHHISAEGISPDQDKAQALIKMPMPSEVSQLRSLLGCLGYYRKFIPRMAARLKPLRSLLKKGTRFQFPQEHESIAKEMLLSLTGTNVLAFPHFEDAALGKRPFMLTTNASLDGLGAVVEQLHGDNMPRREKLECVRIRGSGYCVGHQEEQTTFLRSAV
ncbi:unnamed protein product [Sphacelaria rigidula]